MAHRVCCTPMRASHAVKRTAAPSEAAVLPIGGDVRAQAAEIGAAAWPLERAACLSRASALAAGRYVVGGPSAVGMRQSPASHTAVLRRPRKPWRRPTRQLNHASCAVQTRSSHAAPAAIQTQQRWRCATPACPTQTPHVRLTHGTVSRHLPFSVRGRAQSRLRGCAPSVDVCPGRHG